MLEVIIQHQIRKRDRLRHKRTKRKSERESELEREKRERETERRNNQCCIYTTKKKERYIKARRDKERKKSV